MKSTDQIILVDEDGKISLPEFGPGSIIIYDAAEGRIHRGEAIVGTARDIETIYHQGFHSPERHSVARTTELHTG